MPDPRPQIRFSKATLQRAVSLRSALSKNSIKPVGFSGVAAWSIELAYELGRYLDEHPADMDLYGQPPRHAVQQLMTGRRPQAELPLDDRSAA